MALAVGIWLALLGYTVAWAGWRNMGISYAPQTDGSVMPSQPPVTLLDAFTCRTPASSSSGPPPSSAPRPLPPASLTPLPAPQVAPAGNPGFNSIFNPIAVPRPLPAPAPPRPPLGLPNPGGLITTLEQGLASVLRPLLVGAGLVRL